MIPECHQGNCWCHSFLVCACELQKKGGGGGKSKKDILNGMGLDRGIFGKHAGFSRDSHVSHFLSQIDGNLDELCPPKSLHPPPTLLLTTLLCEWKARANSETCYWNKNCIGDSRGNSYLLHPDWERRILKETPNRSLIHQILFEHLLCANYHCGSFCRW